MYRYRKARRVRAMGILPDEILVRLDQLEKDAKTLQKQYQVLANDMAMNPQVDPEDVDDFIDVVNAVNDLVYDIQKYRRGY